MGGAHYSFGDTAEQYAAEAGAAMGPYDDQVGWPASGFRYEYTGDAIATGLEQLYLRCHACLPRQRLCLCQYFFADARFYFFHLVVIDIAVCVHKMDVGDHVHQFQVRTLLLMLGKPGGFLYCKVGGCTTVNWNQNILIHCYPRKHHSLARSAAASGPEMPIRVCSKCDGNWVGKT